MLEALGVEPDVELVYRALLAHPSATPAVGERVEFVAGYCDSTLFLHDELYGVRDGRVEVVWPVLGRGRTR